MEVKPLKKILFVDDDEDILIIAKYALKSLKDIEIYYVSSGNDALAKAIEFKPDLILLDVMMPVMDGVMTLNAIRSTPEIKETPVIFFTAKVTQEEIFSYHNMDVIDILTKPFDPNKLGPKILKIWGDYQRKKGRKYNG